MKSSRLASFSSGARDAILRWYEIGVKILQVMLVGATSPKNYFLRIEREVYQLEQKVRFKKH